MRALAVLCIPALFLLAPPALAQEPAGPEDQETPEKILRRIRGEIREAEKLLLEAGSSGGARGAQERAVEEIRKLLDGARSSQDSTLADLQKLIDFT